MIDLEESRKTFDKLVGITLEDIAKGRVRPIVAYWEILQYVLDYELDLKEGDYAPK